MSATTISDIHERKHLLRHRARLAEQWHELFPQHDFEGQLRFEQDVWADPGWAESAREYHKARCDRILIVETPPEELARLRELRDCNVSLDQLWYELNDPRSRPTPQMTIEAILSCVRERGIATLDEPKNIERLRGCNVAALAEINQRIGKLKVIGSHG
jgi:hypothetical protein